jgi:F0F1-type ATP synthase membrane subunit c/vacuolar-type H+-ATPase subunit K
MADRAGNGPDTVPPPNGAPANGPPPNGTPGGASAQPPPADDGLDLKARLDRFGDLLGKGLDLAEAGLSLGLTVVGTLGAAAQQKIFEKMMEATAADPAAPAAAAAAAAPPAAGAAPADAPPAFGITNRLRLAPGMPVSISFSINNDSAAAPKQVALRVEPFTGERTGAMLPPASLSVTPEAAAIAPMDFEKFVLRGAIPETSPADIYHGSIAVTAEDSMRIPVLLVIET